MKKTLILIVQFFIVLTGHSQVLVSKQQRDTIATRLVNGGRYFALGHGYTNSPADGSTTVANATNFLALPLWAGAGNGDPIHASVWTGYPNGRPDTDMRYPQKHLYQAKDAALCYAANPNTYRAHGLKVVQALLAQIDVANNGTIAGRTTFLPNWHTANNDTAGGITAEIRAQGRANKTSDRTYRIAIASGTQECAWMARYTICYDLVKPLCTQAERTRIETYIAAQAMWVATREVSKSLHFTALYPNWLTGNFATKGYLAADTLADFLGEKWNKANANNPREAVWANASDGSGYLYTHRKSNGALSYRIAKSHEFANNQSSIRMQFVAIASAVLPLTHPNNAYLYNVSQRYGQLFIVNSVYPDGTTAEQLRDGDYAIPAEGAGPYNSHNVQFLLVACHAGLLRGDSTMVKFSTSLGSHGTIGGPKTVRKVLDRLVNIFTDTAIYHGPVLAANKISEFVPTRTYVQSGKTLTARAAYLPHIRYMMLWANKFYPSARFVNFAKGSLSGQTAVPAALATSGIETRNNGPIPDAWRGAFADWLPYHLLYADATTIPTYPLDMGLVITGGGTFSNIVAKQVQATGGVSYSWRIIGGNGTAILDKVKGPIVSIQSRNGKPLIAGTYRVQCTATLASGQKATRHVDININ